MSADKAILSHPFVHADRKRPQQVKTALKNEFGLPDELASTITARMYGFPDMQKLEAVYNDPRVASGVPDEQAGLAVMADRQMTQAQVIFDCGLNNLAIAQLIASCLKPTGAMSRPSLRAMRERLFDLMDISENVGFDLFSVGDDQTLANSMEAIRRIPQVWLDFLAREIGWFVRPVDGMKTFLFRQVGETMASDGKVYPIFMTSFAHSPAMEASELDDLQRFVEEQSPRDRAVVLFSKPTCNTRIALEREDPSLQLLYGGMALDGGEWWNFVLRPEAGFGDVLAQRGQFKRGRPSVRFAMKFGYENAIGNFVDLHKMVNNLDDDGLEEEEFLVTEDAGGWTHFITR